MKTEYRFLHLSDIHFGQERSGDVVVHEDAREMLIRDATALRNKQGSADGIIVTGDSAYSGAHEEYKAAGDFLERLAAVVGCEPISVRVIPGNHDVDRKKINRFCELAHQRVRNCDAAQVEQTLAELLAEEESGNPLFPKLAEYREFARRFGCDFESSKKSRWSKDVGLGPQYTLRILGMNTADICDGNDRIGNIVLGNSQYVFTPTDDVVFMALLHHPTLWLIDRPNAERYLKRAAIVLCGHEHSLEIRKVTSDDGSEQLQIFAGAVNPPEGSADYPYRYNWMTVRLAGEAPSKCIGVEVWPRVWNYATTAYAADTMRLNGEESCLFEIACPNFTDEKENRDEDAPEVTESQTTEDVLMPPEDDLNFDRLKYYVWTYLEWQERLAIFVKLELLPESQTQPMAQALEQFAIESARSRGLLVELWDLMMQYVPEDKRLENPYARTEEQK